MTVFAALKLVYKRLFSSSNSRNMRSRSVSIEPSYIGYSMMPGDAVLTPLVESFTPIVEAFSAPPEPPQCGNASGLRRVEEGRGGW